MPRFQRISLQNYKSFSNLDLELRNLNILIGKNGSGKSNLLGFFRLIKMATSQQLLQTINSDMGGFAEFRWKGADRTDAVEWKITFEDLAESASRTDETFYAAELRAKGNNYSIQREELYYPPVEGHKEGLRLLGVYAGNLRYLYKEDSPHHKTIESLDFDYETDTELVLPQLQNPRDFQLLLEITRLLASITIFRGFGANAIQNIYEAQTLSVESPLRLHPLGENLVSTLYTLENEHRYHDTKENLYQILRLAFPDFEKFNFPLASSGKAELKWISRDGWDLPARSLSDGTLRFLGLATLLTLPNPPALIAIDEPEVGLHPRLIPLLAELMKTAAEKTQLIVATHSPQLLSAESIDADDVVVVERSAGSTTMNRLNSERLRLWLDNYQLGSLWTMGKLEQA